jgi:pimeloyl-ACP methyl ester carboxylesterase
VTVAENPSAPDRTPIDLFVARVRALNPVPSEDPLTIIAGGPGQAATDFYMSMFPAFEFIRRDRDIILIDQRGTGRSAGLSCPSVTTASLELAAPDTLPALMRD